MLPTPQATTSQFVFMGEYSTPYTALIRSNIVMGVSRYFLERWMPVLGPAPATLVNTLRQLNYRCQEDTITISGVELAREAAMSRRHLYTCLEAPGVSIFVRTQSGQRNRTDRGQIMQQINRYHVRMDDPLTPADADQLYTVLLHLADDPITATQRALTIPIRELWNTDLHSPPEHFTTPCAITARDVVLRAFPTWTPTTETQRLDFAQKCEALQHYLTLVHEDGKTSKIIVPQYLRQKWWKRLGHDLAWIYLWLRGRVYDNQEEGLRRTTCWVPSLNTLLTTINRPREWWRRNVENSTEQADGWRIMDFFKQVQSQKGRDPLHPQWVARQFEIELDIPIAPEDRVRYYDLLCKWQENGNLISPTCTDLSKTEASSSALSTSATLEHTGPANLCHARTRWTSEPLPHWNTLDQRASATLEHMKSVKDCHTQTQESATVTHRKKESLKKDPKTNLEPPTNKHPQGKAAVAGIQSLESPQTLFEQLADALEQAPSTTLYRAVAPHVWLQQAWPEPIRPHTPAWTLVVEGQISPRDLVALMLAVWADASIKHPPRYLSWLIQRWQTWPDIPPIDYWDRWCALAELPLAEWTQNGRGEWSELAPDNNRALPFGLDALWENVSPSPLADSYAATAPLAPDLPAHGFRQAECQTRDGLDNVLEGGTLTVRDVWRATLGQLSVQLSRSTFTNWVEGTQPVSYANGVLTVRAKHITARDQLARRLNPSIELVASAVAHQPLKIVYTADTSILSAANRTVDETYVHKGDDSS